MIARLWRGWTNSGADAEAYADYLRDDSLPVLHLARVFPPPGGAGEPGGIAVIVEADESRAAL